MAESSSPLTLFSVNAETPKCSHILVLKMTFSFAIIGSTAATILKFVNNARTQERWNSVYKCNKVTNFTLSLENNPDITALEFLIHYAINYCVHLERQILLKLTCMIRRRKSTNAINITYIEHSFEIISTISKPFLSKLHIKMLAKAGPNWNPITTPPTCL